MEVMDSAPTACLHCGETYETGQHAWVPAEALNRLHETDPRVHVGHAQSLAKLNGPRDVVLFCRPCCCLCSYMVGIEDDGSVPLTGGAFFNCGGDLHGPIHVEPSIALALVLS